MKNIYIITEGTYYKESYIRAACILKKNADRLCRGRNNVEYKYNKKDDLYENEKENRYRRIDMVQLDPEKLW